MASRARHECAYSWWFRTSRRRRTSAQDRLGHGPDPQTPVAHNFPVGVSLLAIAVCQAPDSYLIHRYREQAHSTKSDRVKHLRLCLNNISQPCHNNPKITS
ncbi:hypothetical protein EMIT0347P_20216 [Pseudomonas sp. IT-347P]